MANSYQRIDTSNSIVSLGGSFKGISVAISTAFFLKEGKKVVVPDTLEDELLNELRRALADASRDITLGRTTASSNPLIVDADESDEVE